MVLNVVMSETSEDDVDGDVDELVTPVEKV